MLLMPVVAIVHGKHHLLPGKAQPCGALRLFAARHEEFSKGRDQGAWSGNDVFYDGY